MTLSGTLKPTLENSQGPEEGGGVNKRKKKKEIEEMKERK